MIPKYIQTHDNRISSSKVPRPKRSNTNRRRRQYGETESNEDLESKTEGLAELMMRQVLQTPWPTQSHQVANAASLQSEEESASDSESEDSNEDLDEFDQTPTSFMPASTIMQPASAMTASTISANSTLQAASSVMPAQMNPEMLQVLQVVQAMVSPIMSAFKGLETKVNTMVKNKETDAFDTFTVESDYDRKMSVTEKKRYNNMLNMNVTAGENKKRKSNLNDDYHNTKTLSKKKQESKKTNDNNRKKKQVKPNINKGKKELPPKVGNMFLTSLSEDLENALQSSPESNIVLKSTGLKEAVLSDSEYEGSTEGIDSEQVKTATVSPNMDEASNNNNVSTSNEQEIIWDIEADKTKIYYDENAEAEKGVPLTNVEAIWNHRKQKGYMAELLVEYNNKIREWCYMSGPLSDIKCKVNNYFWFHDLKFEDLDGYDPSAKTKKVKATKKR